LVTFISGIYPDLANPHFGYSTKLGMKTLLIWQVWLGAFFALGTNDQFSWACIGELGKSIRILKVRQNGRKT
jgi:hypothetical protein